MSVNVESMDEMLRKFRESIPVMIQTQILTAQIIRAKYDALCKEGFTKEQAIELCKGPLI